MKKLLYPFLILLFLTQCGEDLDPADRQVYLEGEAIEGIEFFFPLGFYGDPSFAPSFSPDGTRLSYSNPYQEEGLYLMDLSTQETRLLNPRGYQPDWSPDGKWIAFGAYRQVYKIKTDSDSLIQLTSEGENFSPDWSPNGESIAYNQSIQGIETPSGVWVMDKNGSNKMHLIGTAAGPNWYPTGEKIISFIGISSTSIETKFPVYNFNTKQISTLSATKDKYNEYPQVSPDGSRIVFWNAQGIWIMHAEGKSPPKRILPNHLYNPDYTGDIRLWVNAPSWHPDGEHIIYEHFQITRYDQPKPDEITPEGILVEGYITFYKVHVDSALAVSNL